MFARGQGGKGEERKNKAVTSTISSTLRYKKGDYRSGRTDPRSSCSQGRGKVSYPGSEAKEEKGTEVMEHRFILLFRDRRKRVEEYVTQPLLA